MTSLALPERRLFRVDLYPKVTVAQELSAFHSISLERQWLRRPCFVVYTPFPDFITSARRELMLSAVFLDFFAGAIVERSWVLVRTLVVVYRPNFRLCVIFAPKRANRLTAWLA